MMLKGSYKGRFRAIRNGLLLFFDPYSSIGWCVVIPYNRMMIGDELAARERREHG